MKVFLGEDTLKLSPATRWDSFDLFFSFPSYGLLRAFRKETLLLDRKVLAEVKILVSPDGRRKRLLLDYDHRYYCIPLRSLENVDPEIFVITLDKREITDRYFATLWLEVLPVLLLPFLWLFVALPNYIPLLALFVFWIFFQRRFYRSYNAAVFSLVYTLSLFILNLGS